MEHNKTDDRLLSRIETQAQWDEYLGDFIKNYGDVFLKYGISLDAGIICWGMNQIKNRLIAIEDKLDDMDTSTE